MSEKNKTYLRLPSGDIILTSLIGMAAHYPDHGVMILNKSGEKLLWIPEIDNMKAKKIRDEIGNNLIPA